MAGSTTSAAVSPGYGGCFILLHHHSVDYYIGAPKYYAAPVYITEALEYYITEAPSYYT